MSAVWWVWVWFHWRFQSSRTQEYEAGFPEFNGLEDTISAPKPAKESAPDSAALQSEVFHPSESDLDS